MKGERLRQGVRGLPGSEHGFCYRVDFRTLGPPFHSEAIVLLWLDEPEVDETRLRHLAVARMAEMVERGV